MLRAQQAEAGSVERLLEGVRGVLLQRQREAVASARVAHPLQALWRLPLGALQQHALTQANALAAEALGKPQLIAAQAAHESVLAEFARRCERYMAVIRSTLVSETILRFTRHGIDSATSLLLLAYGLLAVSHGRLTIGALGVEAPPLDRAMSEPAAFCSYWALRASSAAS